MPTFTTKRLSPNRAEDGFLVLDHLKPPSKGQQFFFDDHRDAPRGFGIRITKAGGRAFVLQYYVDGRQRRKTIGDYPTFSLEAARLVAKEMVQNIANGLDPLDEKRRRRLEPTVTEFANSWLRTYENTKSYRAIRSYFDNDILPKIGSLKITDVKRKDVYDIVAQKGMTAPVAARHVLLYATQMFTEATLQGLIRDNPVAILKPSNIRIAGKRNVLKSKKRKRILRNSEIVAFWNEIERSQMDLLTALALKLVLVTGQRPGEVARMHDSEINGRIWVIPGMRRGKDQEAQGVYLTDTATEIIERARSELLRRRNRRTSQPTGHIFEVRPLKELKTEVLDKAVSRNRSQLRNIDEIDWGCWRPHDLRRTMRTHLSAAGISERVAELVIGHDKKGVVATYDQYNFDPEQIAAHKAWEQRLRDILSGDETDELETSQV